MAKKEDKDQAESLVDQSAESVPAVSPPRLPTAHEIITAIKVAGQSLTQADRDEIIRTVALLPQAAADVKPSPYDGLISHKFLVSYGDGDAKLQMEIVARNDREAWALACDAWKEWPGPKRGKVELIGPAVDSAAA